MRACCEGPSARAHAGEPADRSAEALAIALSKALRSGCERAAKVARMLESLHSALP